MGRRRGGVLPAPRRLVEPVAVAEQEFFRSGAFYGRVALLGAVALSAVAVVAVRAWSLQVLHRNALLRQSEAQQTRIVELPASRGIIFDDKMRPLATDGAKVVVVADPSALGGGPLTPRWRPSAHGRRVLRRLARLTGVPTWRLVTRIDSSLAQSPFAPAVVLYRVSQPLAFYLDERARRFPGLHVVVLPIRAYPQGRIGGAFLGVVGQVSAAQLKERLYAHARPGQLVGQTGVEAVYDRYLNGGFERARVRVDARGAIASPLRLERWQRQPAALQLTIDSRVQRAAERALRLGIKLAHAAGYRDADAGAAVVLEARTGAIKALASAPSVDEAAAANDPRYLQRLVAGRVAGTPLFNRATQGLYPAGSTFKPVVAQAALAAHLISPSSELACTGSLQVGNVIFHNVEASINALLTLPQALAVSCDTWFYRLGEDFYWRQLDGQSLIQNWARSLGLGHPTGIDLPAESGGIVPTPRWLRATFPHTPQEQWYEGTSVNLAIGQGYLAITPLQLAVAYAALANGGTVVRPHLARAILRSDGRSRRPLSFPARRRLRLPDL